MEDLRSGRQKRQEYNGELIRNEGVFIEDGDYTHLADVV
jgi:hypothetical protein